MRCKAECVRFERPTSDALGISRRLRRFSDAAGTTKASRIDRMPGYGRLFVRETSESYPKIIPVGTGHFVPLP
jgi:hypothetical protein